MDEILYLEPDEEITSVVDKLKGLEADSVGLVAPKGSTIVQSLVSLKLLQKQAKQLGKDISIITSDEVGQNLASRIDLPVYADVKSRKPVVPRVNQEPENDGPIELDMTEGEAKVAEKDIAKPKTAQKEEDYGDLPKDFEVHRYDEKEEKEEIQAVEAVVAGAMAEEAEKAEAAEPVASGREASSQEPTIRNAPEPTEEKRQPKDGFSTREVGEKSEEHIDRDELEAARPTSIEDHKKSKSIKGKKSPKTAIIISLCVVFFLALLVAADLAVVKLRIVLSIPADPIEKTVLVSVEKDRTSNDFPGGAITGTQLAKDLDVTDSFKATGQKDAGEKAKGTLTFKNSYPTAQSISAGTTVRSSGGVEFVLDQDISVPGATLNGVGDKVLGSITGPVTAKTSGLAGNLSAATSYVISSLGNVAISGATTGGSSKKVTILTKSDQDAAKTALTTKALNQFKDEIAKDPTQIYLPDANQTNFTNFTTSKNVNDETADFTASGKLSITTLLFKSDDFKAAVAALVDKNLPEGKSLLVTNTDSITPSLNQENINVGKLQVNGEIKSHVGPKIDLTTLEKSWKLKPIKKVKTDLEKIEGATINEVKISPSFALPIAPFLSRNIEVKIDYTKK
jgi:hypothetical protein